MLAIVPADSQRTGNGFRTGQNMKEKALERVFPIEQTDGDVRKIS